MASHRPEREFRNTRARYQRLSDSRFLTGWVEFIGVPDLTVRGGTDVAVQPGEKFLFELFGQKANLTFLAQLCQINSIDAMSHWDFSQVEGTNARVMQVADASYDFKIISEYKFTDPKEDCRKSVQSMIATLVYQDEELDVSVNDISASGIGVVLNKKLKQGEPVAVRVVTMLKTITLDGRVRYSRKDAGTDLYKTGILFLEMDRVNQAAWDHMVQAA